MFTKLTSKNIVSLFRSASFINWSVQYNEKVVQSHHDEGKEQVNNRHV